MAAAASTTSHGLATDPDPARHRRSQFDGHLLRTLVMAPCQPAWPLGRRTLFTGW